MADDNKEKGKKARVRSPQYPSMSLPDALAKARMVYDVEHRIPTTDSVILGHMGYENKTGPAGRAISALKQYGLLEEQEDGGFRISEAAFRYFELPAESTERQQILRDAALRPTLFSELLTKYSERLPSDATLRSHLIIDKHFNPAAVPDVIRVFRATMDLAKPHEDGYIPVHAGKPEGESKPVREAPVTAPNSPHVGPKEQSFGMGTTPIDPSKFRLSTEDGRPMAFRKATELAFKLSRASEARVTIYGDASQEAIQKLRALLELQEDTFPTNEEIAARGNYRSAVWRNKDHDQPVTVTGDLGVGADGRKYLKIAESQVGIPEDEIVFENG